MKAFVLFAIILLGYPVLYGQEKATVLKLEDFIERVLRNDPSFERILLQEIYVRYKDDLELDPADLILEIKAEYGLFRSSEDESLRDDLGYTVSLKQLFPQTGTELSAYYQRIASITTGLNRYNSVLGVEVSQDIIRNAFGKSYRLQAKKTKIAKDILHTQIVEAYEDYLALLHSIYLQWYSASEKRKAFEKTWQEEKRLLNVIAQKRRLGAAHEDELTRARVKVIEAQQNVVEIQAEEENIQARIRMLMGEQSLKRTPEIPILTQFADTGVERQAGYRTYKLIDLMQQENALSLQLALDELLPSTKLFAGYSLLSRSLSMDKPDHKMYFGASFTLNFTQKKERANYEVAQLNQKDIDLYAKELKRRFLLNIESLERQWIASQEIARLAQEKERLATLAVQQLTRQYNIGKTSFQDLVAARQSLADARQSAVQHMTNSLYYQIELLRLKDELVRKLPRAKPSIP